MKSLKKSLSILEYIILQEGRAILPTEISQTLNINIASSVRMLKALTERSFLTQISRTKGYIIGPVFCQNILRHNIYHELITNSQELLNALAKEFKCIVNLSIIHNSKRFLLYVTGQKRATRQTEGMLQLDWHFNDYATEQLLISTLSLAEREKIITQIGLPKEFKNMEELNSFLEKIKSRKYIYFFSEKFQVWIVGVLLEIPEKLNCTFALSVKNFSEIHYALDKALKVSDAILLKFSS